MAGSAGGGSSGAPAEMYTTTFSNALPGPVTTFSALTGLAYCFAQLGSMDISMVRTFAGVPSKLTRPLMEPFPGLADEIVNIVKIAATAIIAFPTRIVLFLLISYENFHAVFVSRLIRNPGRFFDSRFGKSIRA